MSNGWIQISEGLPSWDALYLIRCESGDPDSPFYATAWFNPDTNEWSLVLHQWKQAITHWKIYPKLEDDE